MTRERKSIVGRGLLFLAGSLLPLLVTPSAQGQSPVFSGHDVVTGGDYETYLRDLQVAGHVPLYPWTARYLSPREVARIAPADSVGHPWASRITFREKGEGARFRWIAPQANLRYNTRSPYGYNDGVIWAGAGATTSIQAGFAATFGPLFLRVSPIAFWAQNRTTPLVPSASPGSDESRRFADPDSPGSIDLPQRFGDGAYSRIDLGESTVRIDLPGIGFGVSTALQQWGPGWDQPLIMSNNAPGFVHAFVGANKPIDIFIGSLYGRVVWGKLESTEYSPQGQEEHFMSGIVASFSPRGIDGLEVGGSRFFHSPLYNGWPKGRQLLKPFESFLKVGLPLTEGGGDNRSDVDNQLASAFARWTFPQSGFEFYGEFAREDHNWNLRDFLVEPDHDSAYTLGMAKTWEAGEAEMYVVRVETMNALVTHLDRVRPQTRFYRHGGMSTGHTNRGQILGAAAGYSGASNRVSVVRYDPNGSWTADLRRWVHREDVTRTTGRAPGDRINLTFELGRTLFVDDWELETGLSATSARGGTDANRFNLSLNLGARLLLFSRDGD